MRRAILRALHAFVLGVAAVFLGVDGVLHYSGNCKGPADCPWCRLTRD